MHRIPKRSFTLLLSQEEKSIIAFLLAKKAGLETVYRGFTLLEVAIVLLILGLILGSMLMPLSAKIEQEKIQRTRQILTEIKDSLVGYAILNNRLPCPAVDENGIASTDKINCEKEGYIPWRELSVGRYDGWGNPFRYRVEEEYKELLGMKYTSVVVDQNLVGSSLTVRRKIQPNKKVINSSSLPESSQQLAAKWLAATGSDSRIAAIVFSCGKNGRPDPTPHPGGLPSELFDYTDIYTYRYSNDADNIRNVDTQCNNPGTKSKKYVQNDRVANEPNEVDEYDDILIWLSRNTLTDRMVRARWWPQ